MTQLDPKFFEQRRGATATLRAGDERNQYQRDRARIIHSAAFRRLQGKTQVMGVGEGDFHRTRLTHSIECAQIGSGLLEKLSQIGAPAELAPLMPERDLVEAACFAHDLGHPPFGHGGERALHKEMACSGGFEGNGQTLRIVSRLEKYSIPNEGIDPTRRLVLAILKYPVQYSSFKDEKYKIEPPKCFFGEELEIVNWAMDGFSIADRDRLTTTLDENGKPAHRTFDCGLMELADDIAYGIHDIEDVVSRRLVDEADLREYITDAFSQSGGRLTTGKDVLTPDDICDGLFEDSFARKQIISRLVNLFVTQVNFARVDGFEHPLLSYRVKIPDAHANVLKPLRKLALALVASKAKVQQLERRGQMVVEKLFSALLSAPAELIPQLSWEYGDVAAPLKRRVCDYVAGMTDNYAEKVYRRLFVPGYGSGTDEL